jgi:hypothetical protein
MKDLKHIKRFNEAQGNLNISDVSISLFGLYSPEDELMFVHKTKEGAKKHQYEFEKAHGIGFYIDTVMVLD